VISQAARPTGDFVFVASKISLLYDEIIFIQRKDARFFQCVRKSIVLFLQSHSSLIAKQRRGIVFFRFANHWSSKHKRIVFNDISPFYLMKRGKSRASL
jgi:hypothetical protein